MEGGKSLVWVMVGGALGAAARYLVGGWARRFGPIFPWGTLIINLSGCLILGIFSGLRLAGRYAVPAFLTPAFGIGFVGAYTTFSTFAVETVLLIQEHSPLLAFSYVAASVVAGLIAAGLGLVVGRAI